MKRTAQLVTLFALVVAAMLAFWPYPAQAATTVTPSATQLTIGDEMDSITRLAREVVAALHQYHQEKP